MHEGSKRESRKTKEIPKRESLTIIAEDSKRHSSSSMHEGSKRESRKTKEIPKRESLTIIAEDSKSDVSNKEPSLTVDPEPKKLEAEDSKSKPEQKFNINMIDEFDRDMFDM